MKRSVSRRRSFLCEARLLSLPLLAGQGTGQQLWVRQLDVFSVVRLATTGAGGYLWVILEALKAEEANLKTATTRLERSVSGIHVFRAERA